MVNTQEAAGVLAASRHKGAPLLHLSGCAKGCAHPGPAAITLVGEAGGFALIHDGRAGDAPASQLSKRFFFEKKNQKTFINSPA
jgi:precorrin-3B synthase